MSICQFSNHEMYQVKGVEGKRMGLTIKRQLVYVVAWCRSFKQPCLCFA